MTHFSDARQAKEFLVSRIVAEAQRENVPLSEVERKMLYFSETDWTLPDIAEVNDKFDRECDQDKYEKKIAHLIRSAMNRSRRENPEDFASWLGAIRKLKTEDHYILVMVDEAGVSTGTVSDSWKSLALIALFGCFLAALVPILRYFGLWLPRFGRAYSSYSSYSINLPLSNFVGYAYVGIAALYVVGVALLHFDPKRRVYVKVDAAIIRAFRIFKAR